MPKRLISFLILRAFPQPTFVIILRYSCVSQEKYAFKISACRTILAKVASLIEKLDAQKSVKLIVEFWFLLFLQI